MNTKTVAIALVAIIVVAGVAVSIPQLLEEEPVTADGEGRLLIYGNANLDDYISDADVKYLEQVIEGKSEENRFCDANQDGDVTEADVDFVKKMVDREPMDIYYLNTLSEKAEKVAYPIEKVITVLDEPLLAVKIMDKFDNLVGYTNVWDKVLYSDVPKEAKGFSGNKEVPIETISKLDADAVISISNINYVTNEEQIEDAGLSVIRVDLRDANCVPGYLTLGYLMDAEERTGMFVKMVDDTLNTIADKVDANMKAEDKIRGMVLGYNVIYGQQSDVGPIIDMAGGINAVDWYEHRFCNDGFDWLYEYDFDYIVGRSPGGYSYGMSDDQAANDQQAQMVKGSWTKYTDRYKLTDAIINDNLALVDQGMPTYVMAAYLAAEFYPDLFDKNFGATVHQEFLDTFLPNLAEKNYDVTKNGLFFMNSEIIAGL